MPDDSRASVGAHTQTTCKQAAQQHYGDDDDDVDDDDDDDYDDGPRHGDD